MDQKRNCHICGVLIGEKESIKGQKYRCKKCHSEAEISRQLLKKTAISPQDYYQCLDCDHVFHYLKTRGSIYIAPVERDKCPKCESVNFDDYIN